MGNQLYWVLKTYTERRGTTWLMDWRILLTTFFVSSWISLLPGSNRDFPLVPDVGSNWPSAASYIADGELRVTEDMPIQLTDRLRGLIDGELETPISGLTIDPSFVATHNEIWNRDDFFARIPNLRGVRFDKVANVSQVVAQLRTLPDLAYLEFNGVKLSSTDVAALASIPNLQYLRLESCRWENSLRELEQASRLRRLVIVTSAERKAHIVTADVDKDEQFRVPRLPQLEVLAVDSLAVALVDGDDRDWPTDADLAAISELPKLRRVFVRDDGLSAKPMREIERVLPHVLVLPIYVAGGNLLFMSFFLHGLVILRLAAQVNAQTVTTLSPVVPRYWLPHQIVFVGLALVLAGHQTLQLWTANVEPITAMGLSLSYYAGWAVAAFAALRNSISVEQTTQQTIFEWLAKIVSALMLIGFILMVMTQEAVFHLTEMQIFLLGKFPHASLLLLGAGLAGLIILAALLPFRFRTHYETYDTLPPMTFTHRSQVEWAQMLQEKRKRKRKPRGAGRFAGLTPGSVFNDAAKRSQLIRDGNKLTVWRVLGQGLLSIGIVLLMWGVGMILPGEGAMRANDQWVWVVAWVISSFPVLGMAVQWDDRRRTMGLELMRPVGREYIRNDMFRALSRDTYVAIGFQTLIIIGFWLTKPPMFYVSVPVVLVILVSWCVIPTYVMNLLTIPREEDLFGFLLVFAGVEFACHFVVIASQFGLEPVFQWILAIFAVLMLCASIERAKKRWRNLEWDA